MKDQILEIIKGNSPEKATDKILNLIAKPNTKNRSHWVCNECNFSDYTDAFTEDELKQWLQCSNCGGDEFHLEEDK